MIVCENCGASARERDSYCSTCGHPLKRPRDSALDRQPNTPGPAAPEPKPAPGGWVPPRSFAPEASLEATPGPPAGSAAALATSKPEPATATHEPASSLEPALAPEAPTSAPERAPSAEPPLAPVSEPAPPPEPATEPAPAPAPEEAPTATPGRQYASRFDPAVAYPTTEAVCSQCGTRHPGAGRFCQRCGAQLSDGGAETNQWGRADQNQQRPPPPYDATRPWSSRPAATPSRPSTRWARTAATALVGAVVLGTLLSYVVVPGFRTRINYGVNSMVKATDRLLGIGVPAVVRPVKAEATSAVPGHPPSNLIDLISDDYWAADTSTDRQLLIRITFSSPTDIDDLLVTTGAGPDYANLARPKDVQLTYSDGTTENLTLQDDPKPTRYEVHGSQIRSVDIRILSVYPVRQNSQVAIAEIEFFRLS